MIGRRFPLDALGMIVGVMGVLGTCGAAAAQHAAATAAVPGGANGSALTSVDTLPPQFRDGGRLVLEHPTLQTRGPTEIFRGNPDLYQWLLDHPDRGVFLWRQMGAKCLEIKD